MVAHLVWVIRIVLGRVLGAHSTVQRCLLLLQLLECLSSLRNSNINADNIRHCDQVMDDGREVGDGRDDAGFGA